MKRGWLVIFFILSFSEAIARVDTTLVNRILEKSEYFKWDNPDSLYYYASKSLQLSKKIKYDYGLVKSYYFLAFKESNEARFTNCIAYIDSGLELSSGYHLLKIKSDLLNLKGTVFSDMGDFDKSIEFYLEAEVVAEKGGYDRGTNIAQTNIGVSYYLKGDFHRSLDYFSKTRKYFEGLNDTTNYIICLTNISSIYTEMKQYDLALEVLEDGRGFCEGIPGQQLMYSDLLSQIALINEAQGNVNKALTIYFDVVKIKMECGDWRGLARIYNNIGETYHRMDQLDNAIKMSGRAIEIADSLGYDFEFSNYTRTMAIFLNETGRYEQAYEYAIKSLEVSERIGAADYITENLTLLAGIFANLNDYKNAYRYQLRYSNLKDSLQRENSDQAMEEMAVLHQLDKRELENSRLQEINSKNEILQKLQEEQLAKDRVRFWFLTSGLILVLGLMIISFFAYRNKKKSNILISQQKHEVEVQKVEIERQHLVLEEIHTEIKDSIRYAKRIQAAILPSDKLIKKLLPESFVLYKPKDIVAGDFYWLQKKDDKILIAAADCTGHGVPGAMVSVVCNNALNRSVREYGITDPGKILDKTRAIVIEEFEKSDEEVKDGMDISLCSISLKNMTLDWAGANNPLWIIKNGTNEIIEVKADKQPIGKYGEAKPFVTHCLQLEKGDSIYIFTDGYQDQFGGDKGKKFKGSRLKETVIEISEKPIEVQGKILSDTLEAWRGSLEQIDDVCVIGIRI